MRTDPSSDLDREPVGRRGATDAVTAWAVSSDSRRKVDSMHIRRTIQAAAAAALLTVPAVALTSSPASAARPFATAGGVRLGDVSFTTERGSNKTIVNVKLRGHSGSDVNSFHGFHIHANDNPSNGDGCVADATQPASTWFVSADGHWKLDPAELHGKHAGDLASVFINSDGTTSMKVVVSKLTPTQIVGKALILHAGPDNFGNVPVGPAANQYTPGAEAVAATQATGNAGVRIGCAVISGR